MKHWLAHAFGLNAVHMETRRQDFWDLVEQVCNGCGARRLVAWKESRHE